MKKSALLMSTVCLFLMATIVAAEESEGTRTYYKPEGLSSPALFSHVITTTGGTLVHVSGQTARAADGKIIGAGDLKAQLHQAMERLKIALSAAGASFDDVIRRRVFVVDLKSSDREIVVAVLAEYFTAEHPPTSTLIGVTSLAQEGYLVEIDVTAHLP